MSNLLPVLDVSSRATRAAEPCCAPLTRAPLAVEDAERAAGMFKALGDPVRLRLFSNIASADGGEACVCDIQDVGVSQPTVSHHLKKLLDAGLVEREQRGKWAYYALKRDAVETLAAVADLKGVCCR